MGSPAELFVFEADTDVNTLTFCLSLRKCVDCHLSYGLTQREAGHCNNTCAPLVGYMDDVSGTANRICFEHNLNMGVQTICSFVEWRKADVKKGLA